MKLKCLILLLLFSISAYSKDIRFNNFGTDDGLSNESSYKLIQDHEGFIWVGTYDGLCRFDGIYFKTYKSDLKDTNSIAGNVIMDLMIDKDGNLWLSTNQGVCMYNKQLDRFEKRIRDKGLHQANIRSCIQDHAGNFWFASGKFIFQVGPNYKVIQILNQDLDERWIGNSTILCLLEDSEGTIWITTQEKGLFSYDPRSKIKKSYADQVVTKEFFTASEDSYGNIWFGTNEDPYIFVLKERKFYNLRSPDAPYQIPPAKLSSVADDKNGTLWISNWGEGITRYNVKLNTYETFTQDENDKTSISGGSIEYAFIDHEGNVWTVGQASGLNVVYNNNRAFNYIKNPTKSDAGIFSSPTTAISHDTEGNLWFGTDGGGLSMWDPVSKTYTNYKENPQNPKAYGGTSVLTLFVDSKDNVWAGGYNSGLNLFDKTRQEFTVFKTDNPPPYTISGKDIRYIIEDKSGKIWVATNGGGINVYDPITWEHEVINVANSKISSDYCLSLLFDKKERLFIATYNGLSIFDPAKRSVRNYQEDRTSVDSLQSSWIYSVFQDSKGRYWIGTQIGLSLYNDTTKSFKTYLEEDGLANNTVMAITEDQKGRLWISTGKGISLFDPERESFQNYSVEDGLPHNQFRMGSCTRTPDGTIFFGSNNGVLYFNPDEITKNETVPIVRLTNLYINTKLVHPGESRILRQNIDYTNRIVLKHKENFLRIDFVALSYFQSAKNTYRYILEGVDPDWVECGTNTSASYTNLPHGNYTFQVMAYNNDGIPSDIRSIKIRIRPAWYNTLVFYILLIIIAVFGIYSYIKTREAQSKKEKEILEHKLAEGEKLIQEKMKLLENQENDIRERDIREKEIRFYNEGMANLSQTINQNRRNIGELATRLIAELVEYIGANVGIIFIADDSNPQNVNLRAVGDYCFDYTAERNTKFAAGEGYIGTCYQEKKTIEIPNLPQGQMLLKSGLGKTSLRYCLIVPALQEETCLGVIEIAAIKNLEKYKVNFVEKIAENISSVFAILKANEKMEEMLKQNIEQSEILKAQEEELRQNLEEMQATQEDLNRQVEASNMAKLELAHEKMLVDSLLKTAHEKIYFKDCDGQFIKVSQSMAQVLNVKEEAELVGKTDFDFFTEEYAQTAIDEEAKVIKTGVPIIDKIEKETYADGRVTYASTTKMPLRDEKENIIGIFGISKDITSLIQLEDEMKMVNEKLEFEKIMFATLMDNISARITYKDTEARYTRINKTKSKALGLKDPSEVIGKTDLEVFIDTHTKERLLKEIEQIREGASSFNVEELIKQKDGTVKWGDTNRIPLRNKEGEIVGGLVITWDITDKKNMQFELEQDKLLLKNMSDNLPLVIFNTNNNGIIRDITGNGLNLLGIQNDKTANKRFAELFPEIKQTISDKKNEGIIEYSGKLTLDKAEIEYDVVMMKHKTTVEEFTGYILFK